MRNASLWRALLGVEKTVVEDVEFDEDAGCRRGPCPAAGGPSKGRCGRCGRRAGWYDRGEGRRRWRALDLGTVRVFLEADAPRVNCREHGPTVRQVPWARHGAGHTHAFDEQVAWLATQCSKTAVTELMRIAWRTVGAIITRVWADIDAERGPVRRAAPDRDRRDLLQAQGPQVPDRGRRPRHRPAGVGRARPGHGHPARVLRRARPRAQRPAHPRLRRRRELDREHGRRAGAERGRAAPTRSTSSPGPPRPSTRSAARPGTRPAASPAACRPGAATPGCATTSPAATRKKLKRARYALWKNPENLTDSQQRQAGLDREDQPRLHRAYLLKEGLRLRLQGQGRGRQSRPSTAGSPGPAAAASRRLRRARPQDRRHRPAIHAALEHGLSNALVESVNTKIRLLTRIAFGFHGPEPLIALAMLTLGGHRPALPGRN